MPTTGNWVVGKMLDPTGLVTDNLPHVAESYPVVSNPAYYNSIE